jgi:hypothetical protein
MVGLCRREMRYRDSTATERPQSSAAVRRLPASSGIGLWLNLEGPRPRLANGELRRIYALNNPGDSCAWVMPTSVITVPSGRVMTLLSVGPRMEVDCAVAMMFVVNWAVSFW